MTYNPQGLIPIAPKKRTKIASDTCMGTRPSHREYTPTHKNYPNTILRYAHDRGKSLHPTQKPVGLCEYLIRTYTHEGATVLDCFAGSGTTGLAAQRTGRNAVLIERDSEYAKLIKDRLNHRQPPLHGQFPAPVE